jgi:hypothetical protein
MMSKLKMALVALTGWAVTAQTALANETNPPLPEPGTMALVGLGLAAAFVIGRRRK